MPLVAPGKYLVTATWDDVPHLSPAQKAELFAQIPPHQREARARGVPQLGAGAIYPVPETEITVAPFEIPAHWPRAFGLDVGWNRTAAVWGAWDRAGAVLYLYAEHYRGLAEPEVHAQAVRARGEWIAGVIDPASRGRSQADGRSLLAIYQGLGLELSCAENAVEAGIYRVWSLLSTGRLKIFASLAGWLSEYRLYRRDTEGRVVKERDHLMDATRYLVVSGEDAARPTPPDLRPAEAPLAGAGWGPGPRGEAADHDYEMFA
ncbi:phage DNA packaging protein GP2 [Desulfovibrio sp. X2]|uniref:phage terminase large subunit family protein n=1 Tax=Desulfovibrio sp. X2 TaxID=941449 RepID=UPI000358D3D8|nr:terminase family protein [Desulfovibrio sp. X2]EPR44570.1 phage DNA packaging protein GP2 [Desulfovibrio sp. X2]